jgi:hypothetical protein
MYTKQCAHDLIAETLHVHEPSLAKELFTGSQRLRAAAAGAR